MTVIDSMHDLMAVPVGARITLVHQQNATWERDADGFFRRGDFTLSPQDFAADLAHGDGIRLGVRPLEGQLWLHENGWYHYVIAEGTGMQQRAARLYANGSWYGWRTVTMDRVAGEWGRPLEMGTDAWPGWATAEFLSVLRQAGITYAESVAKDDVITGLNRAAGTIRQEARDAERAVHAEQATRLARFEEQVHEWMEDNSEPWDGDLSDLLAEAGFARPEAPKETIEVRVEVEGRTNVEWDSSEAESLLDFYVDEVEPFDVNIDWTTTVTLEVEVIENECGCDEVDQEMVEEALTNRDSDYRWSSLSFSCYCNND